VAYVSLQAVEEGQDSWAAVTEIVEGWRGAGWTVDTWFVDYPQGAPGAVGRTRAMLRMQRELKLRLTEYDAVYLRGHVFALPTSRAARRLRIPVFQECNGTYEDLFVAWPATRLARPLFEHMMRVQYRDADHIFCGTEQQRIWLRNETGHDRIEVSPNGANSDLFQPDASKRTGLPDRYALFFGQFAPWQGIDTLIAAKESAAWPDGVDLVFAGDGARRDAVEAAAARAGSGVHYLGRLPYAELPAVIAHAVASTSPQFTEERGSEGFSALKLYESMSCGVPVIGSDYPGVGDVIRHYECGLVVVPGDAEALAHAVAQIVSAPAEAAEMGRRGREAVVQECSWKARAEQRRVTMERAIAAKRPVSAP
jgi:glycosyltransferase involved in cell wall biosynthesis